MSSPEVDLHPPCQPFLDEFGDVTSVGAVADILAPLLLDPVYRAKVVGTIVSNLIAANSINSKHDTQTPARRAYAAVACKQCILREICPAKSDLEETMDGEAIQESVSVFLDSSAWLKRARLHMMGKTESEIDAILQDEVSLALAIDDGLQLEDLLGGIRSRQLDPVRRDELPAELQSLQAAKNSESFPAELLEFEGCDYAVKVVDMSANNGYGGIKPDEERFGVLTNRMLGAMQATGSDGKPQIVSGGLQKVVRVFDGGVVSEFRMTGKDRLYAAISFAVVAMPDASGGVVYQVYLLGWHGDSEAAQHDFYQRTGIYGMRKPGETKAARNKRAK